MIIIHFYRCFATRVSHLLLLLKLISNPFVQGLYYSLSCAILLIGKIGILFCLLFIIHDSPANFRIANRNYCNLYFRSFRIPDDFKNVLSSNIFTNLKNVFLFNIYILNEVNFK